MRLFISVDVGATVKAAVAELIAELKKTDTDVKWVETENLHLTLCFLGETDEKRLGDIGSALVETAAAFSAFEISFDRLGAFGAPLRPRVLWLGVGTGAKVLSELAAGLREALLRREIRPAEPGLEFSAHLTIGRVRGPRRLKKLVERVAQARPPEGLTCRLDRLILFRSKLSSQGPKYEVLREEPLRPA